MLRLSRAPTSLRLRTRTHYRSYTSGRTAPKPPPIVFTSYSQDDKPHAEKVLMLARDLLRDGVDCRLDRWKVLESEGKGEETFAEYMSRNFREAEWVMLCFDESYYNKWYRSAAYDGRGHGVKFEAHLVRSELNENGALNKRFVPVIFDSKHSRYIPMELKNFNYYVIETQDGYRRLYDHLLRYDIDAAKKERPVVSGTPLPPPVLEPIPKSPWDTKKSLTPVLPIIGSDLLGYMLLATTIVCIIAYGIYRYMENKRRVDFINEFQKLYAQFKSKRNIAFNMAPKKLVGQSNVEFLLSIALWYEPRRHTGLVTVDAAFDEARTAGRACLIYALDDNFIKSCNQFLQEQGYAELTNVYLFTAPLDALNWKAMRKPQYDDAQLTSWRIVSGLNDAAGDVLYQRYLERYIEARSLVKQGKLPDDPFPAADMAMVMHHLHESSPPPASLEKHIQRVQRRI